MSSDVPSAARGRAAPRPCACRGAAQALGTLLLAACGTNSAPERVILPPGASFAAVTDSLTAHNVVSNRTAFTLLARLRGVDRSVHAGVYQFAPRLSAWEVLGILAKGKAVSLRFTVPEGLSILDLAALGSERLGMSEDSLLAAARDGVTASRILGFPVKSFEGFLRPETYSLRFGIGAGELVRLMAQGFVSEWRPDWDRQLDSLRLSRLQLVTLASIVEGEARADDERETIAGVYYNRLRIGMALQADPTVQYAIALKTGKRKPRLYTKDYQFASPYNTYLHPGLPPGPVNSPSRRSIEATLFPARVPYLYFVAGPGGRHLFSRTYDEHLRNIGRVRRWERSGGSGER